MSTLRIIRSGGTTLAVLLGVVSVLLVFTASAFAAGVPVVEGESVSAIAPFDASIEGSVNPEGEETSYHWEYATNSGFTENVKMLGYGIFSPEVSEARPAGPVDLGGALVSATTYYYRLIAKNATGETVGPTEDFTTLIARAPSVSGERVVDATSGTDTIEAQIDPEYQGYSCEIQYVSEVVFKTTGFTESVQSAGCSPAENFGQGGSPEPFTATLSGLEANTMYEYRVVASNSTGTFEGAPQLLSRTPPLLVGSPQATRILQHTVTIQPSTTINPEVEAPLEATYYIVYGAGEANELVTARVSAGSGLAPNTVGPIELSGLQPGTTYQYRIIASNGNATETSPPQTFTTAEPEPLVTSPVIGGQRAQFVNEDGAVIEGEVNPEGLETTYEVQYGTGMGYGSIASGVRAMAPFTSAEGMIVSLVGLSPGTTYHYRIVATNRAGTTDGQDQTLTTPGAPPTTGFESFTIPSVPLTGATPLTFATEEPVAKSTPKGLTNKQKRANALKACRKEKKSKRATCVRHARKEYGQSKKKK
jgi:hypothetical protein